jgi:aspartyl-tRNA(Asn)/glutamyl-tRNA(Gln) amidotransferase subunit C
MVAGSAEPQLRFVCARFRNGKINNPVRNRILVALWDAGIVHDKIMKVTEKDVAYVADLGNLELTEQERARMLRDLNAILGYVDRLNELDTSKVEPMAQVSDRYGVDQSKQGSERFAYASREDIHEGLRKSLPHEEALGNAPDADGTFFRVPKVIER